MPIKGLQTRAAVLGHIKIGGRKLVKTKKGERVIPQKYDHFVVTTNQLGELGYIIDDVLMRRLLAAQFAILKDEHTEHIFRERVTNTGEVEQIYAKTIQHVPDKELERMNEKLRRIFVALPSDDINQNIVTSLSVYDREGCRCRGDGDVGEWVDPKNGEITKVQCPCNMLQVRLGDNDEPDQRKVHDMADRGMIPNPTNGFICKANGMLRVKIAEARVLGGVHLFRTTSMNSIRQLMSAMQEVSDITDGILAGIPLILEVEPKRVSPGPNKQPQIVHVVNLTYKASAIEFLQTAIKQAHLREQMKKQLHEKDFAALPAPGHESPYEQVAIAQEFYNQGASDDIIDKDDEPQDFVDATPDECSNTTAPDQEESGDTKTPDQEVPQDAQEKTDKTVEAPKNEASQSENPLPSEEEKSADPPIEESQKQPVDNGTPEASNEENQKENDNAQENETPKFPGVIIDKPDGAKNTAASKEIRKTFFVTARNKGFTDAQIRSWILELWEAKTSASLKTWQVEAMIDALG